MRIYTIEAYGPAHPQGGRFVRVHVGDFEKVRDQLSPCMISTHEICSQNMQTALKDAEVYMRTLNDRQSAGKPKYKLLISFFG